VPFYPFFWHISETVRAISPHMSRKVECKEDFEKNTFVWRDLTAFITAFSDFVSSTMDVTKPYLHTETVGEAKMTSRRRGRVGNGVQSDCILEHYA